MPQGSSHRPHRVTVIVDEGTNPFEVGVATELFGLPRPELGLPGPLYEVTLCTPVPEIRMNHGFFTLAGVPGLDAVDRADTLVVPGRPDNVVPRAPDVLDALRHAHARGTRILSFCTGAFALAEAGLLDGRRAATHWRWADSFRRLHPKVLLEPDVLFVDEGDILTAAGSAAALDLGLYIRLAHGPGARPPAAWCSPRGDGVTHARGDRDDVFSEGFICPKGASFGAVDSDPTGCAPRWCAGTASCARPPGRRPSTPSPPVSGRSSSGTARTPSVSSSATPTCTPWPAPSTRRCCSPDSAPAASSTASTVDQMPKHVSSGLLYGDANAIPVPDLDHTDHLLLIGANPLESNGSLCTAPDFPGKLKALKARGGTLVVIDPRRTRTAKLADRHIAVRPGTDALLLAAMAQVLYSEGLVEPTPHVQGVEELADALREFTPEAVAPAVTSTPASSAPSPANSPPPPPPPYTAASAAAPSRTAPWPAGSSTS
ncbi:hypothetical protein GCM10011428_49180 [Streptomyces violaceus]